jgi:hypothetical protein
MSLLVAPRMVPTLVGGGGGDGGKGGGGGGGGKGGGGGGVLGGLGAIGGVGLSSGSDGKGGAGSGGDKGGGGDDAKGDSERRSADDGGKGGGGRPGTRTITAADELRAARAALSAMELRLTPQHPDIVRARRAVEELQRRADAEGPERPIDSADPAQMARSNKLREMQTELGRLDKGIGEKTAAQVRLRELQQGYQQHIEATPARETELTELTRDYATLRGTYTSLLQRRLDAQVAANLERRQIGETFKLVDPARLPAKPYSPNRPRIYLLGVGGGIGFGLLLAFLLEYFDRTMRSEADVRAALNIPVLAAIPMIDVRSRRRRRMTPRDLPGAAAMLAVASAIVWRVMR